MTSYGLPRQRRGNGIAGPGNRWAEEKCAVQAIVGENFGGVTPICTLMGEPVRPDESRCRHRSGDTLCYEPQKRRYMLPREARRQGHAARSHALTHGRARKQGLGDVFVWQSRALNEVAISFHEPIAETRRFVHALRMPPERRQAAAAIPPLTYRSAVTT